jgi:sialic acid synthase SpsE
MREGTLSFELALPQDDHARLVLEWRRATGTLGTVADASPDSWESFRVQFCREYFRHPEIPALFALADGKRVAFLRFKPVPHPRQGALRCCEVAVVVAPGDGGDGLRAAILVAVVDRLRTSGYDHLQVRLRPDAIAWRPALVRAGFVELTGSAQGTAYLAALSWGFQRDRVFVIAEAGSNWRMGSPGRDMSMARTLIDVAAEAGADAVKFQTYRPETVYVANAGSSDYLAAGGIKEDIRDIFADLAMPYEMIPELAAHCQHRNVEFMSTPFSVADFDQIDPHVKVHKCASYENSHIRLLERFARSGKPLVMSTGASTDDDIEWAVDAFRSNGGKELCLLQCTASYPSPLEAMNLSVIPSFRRRFGVTSGLSDHSREASFAALAAVALGARVIEKHYTLHPRLPGPDHPFAVDPSGLRALIEGVRAAEKMLGTGIKEVLPAESELRSYARRGIQATRNVAKGELLREGVNIDILRPGKQRIGVHPRFLSELEGKRSARDIGLGDGIGHGDWTD